MLMDQHSWKGSWFDWVWMGTGRSEFVTVQVDRCPFTRFESIFHAIFHCNSYFQYLVLLYFIWHKKSVKSVHFPATSLNNIM